MEKDTIIEVVNKLTGECYPYGSESIDGGRYNNLPCSYNEKPV